MNGNWWLLAALAAQRMEQNLRDAETARMARRAEPARIRRDRGISARSVLLGAWAALVAAVRVVGKAVW
ncbi:MAG: hypothetical protein QN163_03910 [Armatimonadota bacterium]|nr:hypothetical protein [Armatimonadota bacterium]MDR5696838.1 hypothetical protein [Armatimonadota bacterium]